MKIGASKFAKKSEVVGPQTSLAFRVADPIALQGEESLKNEKMRELDPTGKVDILAICGVCMGCWVFSSIVP